MKEVRLVEGHAGGLYRSDVNVIIRVPLASLGMPYDLSTGLERNLTPPLNDGALFLTCHALYSHGTE